MDSKNLVTADSPTTIAGMTTDRRLVFSSGIDEVGQKIVRQANVGVTGLLDDGTVWFLHSAEKA